MFRLPPIVVTIAVLLFSTTGCETPIDLPPPVRDAGTARDGGTPDAGLAPSADAAVDVVDAGGELADAGLPLDDGGTVTDAGATTGDAGPTGGDAGPLRDGGSASDAGNGADASVSTDAGPPDAGRLDAGIDAGIDAGSLCQPSAPNNTTRDSDCDGLSDSEELMLSYQGRKTDPCVRDTDGDGLPDGLEVGAQTTVNAACGSAFVPDDDSNTVTDPTVADSDGDGLSDGVEDQNKNGRYTAPETDPNRPDTDCDGFSDGQERNAAPGCASDPNSQDTDSDGLPDGVEGGLTMGVDPSWCLYLPKQLDTEPATKTSLCSADTDGDGIMDGAEDLNRNGKADVGELNPSDAGDGSGPAHDACITPNLQPVGFHNNDYADVLMALAPQFTEVLSIHDSKERGLIFFDPTTGIGGLAFTKPPAGVDAIAEELFIQPRLGSVSNPVIQTYTSWDGYARSVRATYNVGGTDDVKTKVNQLATTLLNMPTPLLSGTHGATGPFRIYASYVRRSIKESAIVLAVVPSTLWTGAAIFRVDDVGGGSGIAKVGDVSTARCEVFSASTAAKVDFLWVVDDSCSMGSSQTAVGNAGSVFGAKVNGAGLDWRVAGVSTSYYTDGGTPAANCGPPSTNCRKFTTNVPEMQGWFGAGSATGFGTNGSPWEIAFDSSRSFLQRLVPRTPTANSIRIREGASVQLINLSDTYDQGGSTAAQYLSFLRTIANPDAGQSLTVHGILCPEGMWCDDVIPFNDPIHETIRATGGVIGDINVANSTDPASVQQFNETVDAILRAAIGTTGHQIFREPIATSIKVAIATGQTAGTCDTANVPRGRTHGWDVDSATKRLVFYGNCRPLGTGVKIAVSYRSWE